jgi:hypothetical protein
MICIEKQLQRQNLFKSWKRSVQSNPSGWTGTKWALTYKSQAVAVKIEESRWCTAEDQVKHEKAVLTE